jgi:hypothetical protein
VSEAVAEAVGERRLFDQEDLERLSRLLSEAYLEAFKSCAQSHARVGEGASSLVLVVQSIQASELGLVASLLGEAYLRVVQSTTITVSLGEPTVLDVEVVRRIDLSAVASCTAGVFDPLGQLRDFFVSTFSAVADLIMSGIKSFIEKVVTPAIDAISDFLKNTVMPAIGGLVDAITGAVSEGVKKLLETVVLPAVNALTGFFRWVVDSVSDFVNKNVIPMLQSALSVLGTVASTVASSVTGFITQYVIPAITGLGKTIWDALSGAIGAITNFINTYVVPAISGIGKTIWDAIGGAINAVTNFINTQVIPSFTWLWNAISGFINQYVVAPVTGFFKTVIEKLAQLPALVGAGFDAIARTFTGFVNAILRLPELIWNALPDWLRNGLTAIGSFFASVAEFFKDLPGALAKLGLAILEKIRGFLEWLWGGLTWLWKTIMDVTMGVLKAVWDALTGFFGFLADSLLKALQGIASAISSWFMDVIAKAGSAIVKALSDAVAGLVKLARDGAKVIGAAVVGLASDAVDLIFTEFTKAYADTVPKITKELVKTESPEQEVLEKLKFAFQGVGSVVATIFGAHWLGVGASLALHRMADFADEVWTSHNASVQGGGEGSAAPVGIGAKLRSVLGWLATLGWRIKPAYVLREMAKDVRELSDTFTRGLVYGLTIWMTQPMTRFLNAALRDIFVIEMPSVEMMQEIARRLMPTEGFSVALSEYRTILKLYGYRSSIIAWLTRTADELMKEKAMIITVKDRFGTERVIPLSLLYQLPSASDVARMAIRDIFGMGAGAIDAFLKVYSARGMYPDVGVLYYLLHYRYPPPERLWTFVARGWAGMLWATIPSDLMDSIQKEAEKLGAPMPTHARDWNFKAKELWKALQIYMTWHDYARFSWVPKEYIGAANFTSDNQIMLDTLADIPTKIDQRWMARFGLYDFLASRGVTVKSEVRDFAIKILDDSPASKIIMDLSNFSRTLQATGLHPDWVPITAVAETINALADERTLLRTGFIGLFKEGFYDVGALERLLAGFIKASFKVAYFDSTKMEWATDKYVNVPVAFLPAERKLLELRALMDRALDILREVQRDAARAFLENIVAGYDEFAERLSKVVGEINEVYAGDWKAITGEPLPDELKLKIVEDYYKPYVKGLGAFKDVYTVRRMRAWAMRWLGWIMYRVATGIVTKEDVGRLAGLLADYAKLTDRERKFFEDVMEVMAGVAARDYAPTPQQIASLSEYLVVPEGLVEKVFEVKRIGDEWRPIWRQYISVRPVADDIKALISAYRRASLYLKVPEDLEKKVKEYAALINFTDREWAILGLRNQLEEMLIQYRENRREYIPTPMSLATMAEVLPGVRALFDKVAKAKGIPDEWQPVWRQYIAVRPLVDDVRRYVSRAEQLYARFMTDEDAFKKVLDAVGGLVGYEPKEVEFILQTARLERVRYAWSELVGGVDRMIMLAEYSPEARSLALATLNKMIDALPVPDNVKALLKKMWEQFIRIRPVRDEVTSYIRDLINAYVDGVVSWDAFTKDLEEMRQWGLDDYEIMFYKNIATLRKARKLKITIA